MGACYATHVMQMPVVHVVAWKFKAEYSDDAVMEMFAKQLRVKERMPDIVIDWQYGKNTTLLSRLDVNKGLNYLMVVYFKTQADLDAYLPHPQHQEMKVILKPMFEDMIVLDLDVPSLASL